MGDPGRVPNAVYGVPCWVRVFGTPNAVGTPGTGTPLPPPGAPQHRGGGPAVRVHQASLPFVVNEPVQGVRKCVIFC